MAKFLATVFLFTAICASLNAQVQRPNLIMLIADQLRYESCGYAGDAKAITPNIDRLAEQGISFDNYVVNYRFARPHERPCGPGSTPALTEWLSTNCG